VTGACECGDEPSGSIKHVEFLDWLSDCEFLNDSAPWSQSISYALGVTLGNDVRSFKEKKRFRAKLCQFSFLTVA